MKERYRPKTREQRIGWLVEECGEVQAAVGKTLRWGLDGYNPELPPEERETNRDWILRELHDLKRAIAGVEADLLGDINTAARAIGNPAEVDWPAKGSGR